MFPGGLKEIKYKDMMRRKPDEVSCNGVELDPALIL